MTLLASQVESLGNKIEYPFIHEFHSNLSNLSATIVILESNGIAFEDAYIVNDGVAEGTLTIAFTTVEQIVAFLRFERSLLITEVMEKNGLLAVSGGTFRNGIPSTPISRIRDSYERIIHTLTPNLTVVMHSAAKCKPTAIQNGMKRL